MGTLQKLSSLPYSAKVEFPEIFFVTGTDTGIGKTFVSAVLAAGLKAGYWKPIQSGIDPMTDTEWLIENTGLPDHHFFKEAYRLTRPMSPHAAAHIDKVRINLDKLELPDHGDLPYLIVEGAGGVLVPLNHRELMIDLIEKLQIPTIVVAKSSLGTINHTLMTLNELRHRNISILGVVLNGRKNTSNKEAIEHYSKIPVIAEVEPIVRISPEALVEVFEKSFVQE